MYKPIQHFFFIAFLIAMVTSGDLRGQDFSGHNWYFGNSTRALKFSRGDNTVTLLNNKLVLGQGGSATVSDQTNGNLLFYTDGKRVINYANIVMPGTSSPGLELTTDNTQNQPVVTTKVPGSPNKYYIFHRDAGQVRRTIVDMTLAGGAVFPSPALGDVDPNPINKNFPMPGLAGRSEAMIVIPHDNGDDFWLITHATGSPTYTVTLIDDSGTPTNLPPATAGLIQNAANFAYHPLTGKIAVSPKEATRDVEILDFDATTGALLFNTRINASGTLTAASGQAIYDTEWSNSGRFLYISRHGEPGIQADVLQFDLNNSSTSLASVLPQPNTIFRSYGLQMAPDSLMYHLYQATNGGAFFLGAIADTDTVAAATSYDNQAFAGTINFNAKQFSSFAPADKPDFVISFTPTTTCSNSPTAFFPTVTPGADSLVWNYGDGSPPEAGWSPVHTYTTGGGFPVSVTAFLNGVASDPPFTQTVTVTQFDLQITLVSDTTACSCELPLPKAVPPPPLCTQFTVTASLTGSGTIQWFGPTGLLPTQTTATLSPQEAGYYYIKVQDAATSCFAYAGVNIKEYGIVDQRANIWHFGKNAGIDFNPLFDNPPTAAVGIVGPLDTPEGSSVISDRNGQVIISTDGQKIFDRTGTDITPAPSLGGENGSTQSALIIPVPDDETLFYIFTTQQVYGGNTYELRYSLFDLKIGTNGGLVQSNKLLFAKSTERITSNGNWLIAHEYGNNSFRAYRITALGISNPVISGIGSDHTFPLEAHGQGYMEIGGNSKLAVAFSNPGVSNFLEIFDFVDSSGRVTNFHPVDLKTAAGQVYGLEFSGNKIFASIRTAGASPIREIFFDAQGIPRLVRGAPVMSVPGEAGAIQVGPDGTIYVAVNNRGFLGTIQVNGDTLLTSTYTPDAFPLANGTQSRLGLPNFIQIIADPIQGPDITVAGTCEDDSVTFTGTPTDPIDVPFWQIVEVTPGGDIPVTTSDSLSFRFLFPDPGSFKAILRFTNRCGLNVTITEPFQIFAKPDDPNLLPTVLCTTSVQLQAHPVNDPTLTYAWSTGETTRVITVDRGGQFSVTVTNTNGCTSSGQTIVSDNRPIINLGPDVTVCQNTPIAPLDAQNPVLGTTYAWTINGAVAGSAQTQAVSSAAPGVFRYEVTVTSPGGVFGCTATADKTFTFNAVPVFNVAAIATACVGAPAGRIDVTFTGPPGGLFSYQILGPSPAVTGTNQAVGDVAQTPQTLVAGNYAITVTDQVSGCATQTTAAVNNNDFTASFVKQNNCNPVNLVVTHTANPATSFTYEVFDGVTGASVTTGGGTTNPSPFTIPNINAGSYRVNIKSGGCSFTTPITPVTEGPQATVGPFTINACTDPITVTATGAPAGATFAWTGPNITGGAATGTVTADPPQGTQVYTVRVSAPAFCPKDFPVTVNVNNDVIADFTQSDACAMQITLTATPQGPYTYRWFRSGVQIAGGQQIPVAIADNGLSYRVEVVNAVSGCVFTSLDKPVVIAGNLTVTANFPTPLPCENTPFTITTTVNQPGATFQWFLNNQLINGQVGASLVDTRKGLYRVEAIVAGCRTPSSITIIPAPADPGSLPDNALICPDGANPDPTTRQVVLDAGNGFNSYTWFKDEALQPVIIQQFTATEAGLYRVDLVNIFGCASSDKTQVDIECDPRIVAPTAFRPSSNIDNTASGLGNSAFGVLTFFIADTGFEVFIFNRWGEMVFQSKDRLFRWNGAYNNTGSALPAGTYSYLVKYQSTYRPEDGTQEKRGGVLLVR